MLRPSQFYLILFTILCSCLPTPPRSQAKISNNKAHNEIELNSVLKKHPQLTQLEPVKKTGFPVGYPNAKAYYNAQPFGKNSHLGDDWNGVGGGNTDLGDPIFSIANGYVVFSDNIGGGWGNLVRVIHNYGTNDKPVYIESFYAHMKEVFVKEGDTLTSGQKIGTIGTAGGKYLAHLHFEIRDKVSLPVGGGYSSQTNGYVDPTQFIRKQIRLQERK